MEAGTDRFRSRPSFWFWSDNVRANLGHGGMGSPVGLGRSQIEHIRFAYGRRPIHCDGQEVSV